MGNSNCGVFYVAGGKKYVDEACQSARSLKKINPAISISLACNQDPQEPDLFEQIIPINEQITCRNEGLLFKAKYLYDLSPYEKTLFADTDTFFVGECETGFDVLDYFDIALCQAAVDTFYPVIESGKKIQCKPLNTGVIFFRKNDINDYLFKSWFNLYSQKLSANKDLKESDQTSFVEALMYSKSRLYPLPSEWNARFCFINTFCEPVKILHGYSRNLNNIERLINSSSRHRVWIPQLKKCIQFKPYTWRHTAGKVRDQLTQLLSTKK